MSMCIYIFIFICLITLSIIRNCHISRSVRHPGSKLSNWSFSSWLRDKKIDNHRKHRNRWWADFGRCGYQPNSRPGCILQFLYVSSLCKMGAWGQSNVHSNVCTHARTHAVTVAPCLVRTENNETALLPIWTVGAKFLCDSLPEPDFNPISA